MSFSRDPTALVRRFGTRNPFEIAEYVEIKVHYLHHPESKLPGLTCLAANRPSIFINKAYFEAMQAKDRLYTDEAMRDLLSAYSLFLRRGTCHKSCGRSWPDLG